MNLLREFYLSFILYELLQNLPGSSFKNGAHFKEQQLNFLFLFCKGFCIFSTDFKRY